MSSFVSGPGSHSGEAFHSDGNVGSQVVVRGKFVGNNSLRRPAQRVARGTVRGTVVSSRGRRYRQVRDGGVAFLALSRPGGAYLDVGVASKQASRKVKFREIPFS